MNPGTAVNTNLPTCAKVLPTPPTAAFPVTLLPIPRAHAHTHQLKNTIPSNTPVV